MAMMPVMVEPIRLLLSQRICFSSPLCKDKDPNPDKPEKLLATEITEHTERSINRLILNYISAFLCALCALWQKYSCRFEQNFTS
jgi:hypothetical protein